MKKTVVLLLIVLGLPAFGQTRDPNSILNAVKEKYLRVKDYTVDAKIRVDVKFLKMPVKNAKIYFKAPDKIHVQTAGFALLPKKATGFSPQAFIGERYTAIYVNSEKWGNSTIDIVKTIPSEADNDVILSTFWIDDGNRQIRKLEVNSKTAGTYQIELFYNNLPFDMPEKMLVTFDMKAMTMPKTMTGEMNKAEIAGDAKKSNKGKVSIGYANYLVNKGLDDKVFAKGK
jgi:hypothetical protein